MAAGHPLTFFVYLVWEGLEGMGGVRLALRGINVVAGGLIAVSVVVPALSAGLSVLNVVVMVAQAVP